MRSIFFGAVICAFALSARTTEGAVRTGLAQTPGENTLQSKLYEALERRALDVGDITLVQADHEVAWTAEFRDGNNSIDCWMTTGEGGGGEPHYSCHFDVDALTFRSPILSGALAPHGRRLQGEYESLRRRVHQDVVSCDSAHNCTLNFTSPGNP